jgi:hypothetical protein
MTGFTFPGMIEETGLEAWKDDLSQGSPGAAGKQPQVVADFHQGGCQDIQGTHEFHLGIPGGDAFELVVRRTEGNAAVPGNALHRQPGEVGVGVQAGAYGGTAEGQLFQVREGRFDPVPGLFHLQGVHRKFLPKGHGDRILQMGAPELEDIREFPLLLPEGRRQISQGQNQLFGFDAVGNLHRGGNNVVGTLAPVHVIIRMHRVALADGLAQNLIGPGWK